MRLLISTILSLSVFYSSAQTVLFSDNFESSPVTQFALVTGPSTTEAIPDGAPACGKVSRGNTTDFNSANVDFKSSENASYFMGVNSEVVCGGFYTATVQSNSLDLSGVSALYFKGRCIRTTTLGYGGDGSVNFDNGTKDTTFPASTHFPATNSWEDFVIELTSDYIQSNVVITISFVAGDGVAFDNLELSDSPTITSTYKASAELYNKFDVYPTVANDVIHIETEKDFSGSKITILDVKGSAKKEEELLSDNTIVDISSLTSGIYFLKIITRDGEMVSYRIIKQ